jgi:hypothetical protein
VRIRDDGNTLITGPPLVRQPNIWMVGWYSSPMIENPATTAFTV